MLRSSRRLSLGVIAGACLVVLGASVALRAQIAGRNVNMVSGTEWPGGDPFLQRQNEPSIAASTRNPLHLVAGSNDYRSVDVPGLPDGAETGDAWISVYKSFDGGQRWSSTLLPGYPQDTSAAGLASPLKGYQAGADPVVRAGTHGLVYYNGLVFNRGTNGTSAIFLARFIDRNNKENGDPIAYLGTSIVASSDGTTFLDKPWMTVDIPRGDGAMCVVGGTATGAKVKRSWHRNRGKSKGKDRDKDDDKYLDPGLQYVPAGAIYVAYTSITGDGATLQSQIFVKRSMDCGVTWSAPMRVTSTTDRINQGATLAISPSTGDLFVAWRRFSTSTAPGTDAVMVARLRVNGQSFDAPGRAWGMRGTGPSDDAVEKIFEHRKRRAVSPTPAAAVAQIDQPTSPYRFRTNAYPAMAVDGAGRAYIAWSERGYATQRPDPLTGDARIRLTTTLDGRTFSTPVMVDDDPQRAGHQLMPSLAFSKGKLLVLFYDLRETRAQAFGTYVDDQVTSTGKRQTIDIRASLGTPGATPVFGPSAQVSDYLMGYRSKSAVLEQLQVNPPNLPMFKQGTVPFIGDYIDVAAAPTFVPNANGDWVYNTAAGLDMPVFHAAWTDNRDVRPPLDGNWANYTPPTLKGQTPGASLFDPTQQVAVCRAGNAGSRNQNIYTARITGGLLVGSPGNSKQLSSTVQRGFVVFAQNQTTTTRTFRMQVLAQPLQGRASFDQFPKPPYTAASPAPLTVLDVKVPPKSTASRTLYITAPDPRAMVEVAVNEIADVGGAVVNGGLTGRVVLNPDIENPDIENPDIENPDIVNPDIANAEVYNPDIENPDIENPDIENPDIENPDIENPDIENVLVANPDIENLGVANPDIENPDIENPDIENPNIQNPDIENGTISDVTWQVSNTGNTTSAFNVNLLLANAQQPAGVKTQLIVYKVYKTPVLDPNGCDLRTETRNHLLFSVPSPNFITPGSGIPSQNDPSATNATMWLAPGEIGRVTLRVYDNDKSNNITITNLDGTTASIDPAFNPKTVVTAGISAQGVDVLDPPGATKPPVVTTTGTNLTFLQQPLGAAPGTPISPAVRVRVWDNTGAVLPSVAVTINLQNAPGATLSGNVAVTDAQGVATFPALAVDIPVTGAVLRATATSPGVVAAGDSAPFTIAIPGGPVSLWHADGTALDSVGTNHGTLQGGAGYWTGRIGPAFAIANSGTRARQYVQVPDAPSLRMTTNVTMSAWIYPTSNGIGGDGIIVGKDGEYEMARFPDGSIGWAFSGAGGAGYAWVTGAGPGAAPLNTWTHVVVTYASGTVNTYVNGVQTSSSTAAPSPLGDYYPGIDELWIGGRQTFAVNPEWFDGYIDEVGVENRTLTAAEVLTLYNQALPQSSTPVTISNVNAVYDGTAKPVTVTAAVPTVTLYNESTTVPSAIGAYLTKAIVLQNGFFGAASVTHKIASTLPAGGNGGGPYPLSGALSCAPGVLANGIQASTNPAYGLTGAQLTCASGANPAPALAAFEVPSPTFAGATCAPGEVMVGVHGTIGSPFSFTVVEQLGAQCQATAGGPITNSGLVGGGFYPSQAFSLTCPAGQAVTGILGGAGEVIDSIALVCGNASLPTAPIITGAIPASTVAAGFGQLVTFTGTNLPNPDPTPSASFPRPVEQQVVVTQGATTTFAHFVWSGGPNKWTFRLDPSVAPGPATVKISAPGGTPSSNAFPFTVSATPAAPILNSVLSACNGAPITSIASGGLFGVEVQGVDTSGGEILWTPVSVVGGGTITQTLPAATGGPTGAVCLFPQGGPTAGAGPAPALTPGTWTVTVRTQVNGQFSASSNGITVTVQ
ncbi:MAG: LamG-like jellyroll fold domain-containing protein [Vicinamibacterales bacterium]